MFIVKIYLSYVKYDVENCGNAIQHKSAWAHPRRQEVTHIKPTDVNAVSDFHFVEIQTNMIWLSGVTKIRFHPYVHFKDSYSYRRKKTICLWQVSERDSEWQNNGRLKWIWFRKCYRWNYFQLIYPWTLEKTKSIV